MGEVEAEAAVGVSRLAAQAALRFTVHYSRTMKIREYENERYGLSVEFLRDDVDVSDAFRLVKNQVLSEIHLSQKEEGAKPTSELDPKVLDHLPFKSFNKGVGGWIFSNIPEAGALAEALRRAPQKTLAIGAYRYRLSGDDDRFIQRFPSKEIPKR